MLGGVDGDVGGFDGGDGDHAGFEAEFVGGFTAEQGHDSTTRPACSTCSDTVWAGAVYACERLGGWRRMVSLRMPAGRNALGGPVPAQPNHT